MARQLGLTPRKTEFISISFEGPDRYSTAGGLGVRVAALTTALAQAGFPTHLIFVGDPQAPGREDRVGGRLQLHRWSQWISRHYPHGVYHGEEEKLRDFTGTVPPFVVNELVRPALAQGRYPVILAEDWHTADATMHLSDILHGQGCRHQVLMGWNANHPNGAERIDWGRLGYTADLFTVSHYMKHRMWQLGVNPIVVPNGIPAERIIPAEDPGAKRLKQALDTPLTLLKVGRYDPNKRWLMAIDALAQLKQSGRSPVLLMRGGIEAHREDVLQRSGEHGLSLAEIHAQDESLAALVAAIKSAPDADVYELRTFIADRVLASLYQAVDAVLANSGMEPFGLVGLEAMAAGGLVFTGATGEDYARDHENAVVLETDSARELTYYLERLLQEPDRSQSIRSAARSTAAAFTWPRVVQKLIRRLEYLAHEQQLPPLSQPAAD